MRVIVHAERRCQDALLSVRCICECSRYHSMLRVQPQETGEQFQARRCSFLGFLRVENYAITNQRGRDRSIVSWEGSVRD